MKTEIIKAIFTNLLFVIGVLFLTFGFVQGVSTAVKIATFERYPLNSYEETRCQYPYVADAPEITEKTGPTQEQLEKQKKECESQVEFDRQVRKTENIATSISTIVAGAVLIFSFRRFIFSSEKSQSRSRS